MKLVFNKAITLRDSRSALSIIAFSTLLSACSTHQSNEVIIEDRTGGPAGSPSVSTSPAAQPETVTPSSGVGQIDDEESRQEETTPQPLYQKQSSPVIEPKGAVLALLEQAENQHQQGNNQQALTSLERAQRIAPRQPLVYLQLARLHADMGNTQKSQQFARKGLSLSANDPRLTKTFNQLLR